MIEKQTDLEYDMEVTQLRSRRYCIHPSGQYGTCGYYPYPWSAIFIHASSLDDAIKKAMPMIKRQQQRK